MVVNKNNFNKLSIFLFVGCIVVLIILLVVSGFGKGSWMNIRPGQSVLDEALGKLDEPKEVIYRGEFSITRFTSREDLEWSIVEIWTLTDETPQVVRVVMRQAPYLDEGLISLATPASLREVIREHGLPEAVMWSRNANTRHLIWATQGIAVDANSSDGYHKVWEMPLVSVYTFQPMALEKYQESANNWPWPVSSGPSNVNLFPEFLGAHKQDTLPQDPYPWQDIVPP